MIEGIGGISKSLDLVIIQFLFKLLQLVINISFVVIKEDVLSPL